ncbi:hypothetical protein Tco_1005676 [Tanacetum coccineum]|uniref:Uncharacterized protein n=1 Tax=Tanacetum coccineum TaxID=301880 RepID=A0ABQ5FFW0_9ASTR
MPVRIGKFIFPKDFIILDIPEDDDVPLIPERPFLSTSHSKIDVFKRKITLRVGEEKLVFKSVKPATSIIKRVFVIKSLDLETKLIGEGDESFDPTYGFTIIDDDDMAKDVMLGMKFCKKYASCQTIVKKFALGTIWRILGFGIQRIDPTDNQEKDEKQSQNDKTGLGMEKTVKDKAKSKPESQSSQKVNRKVNWSKSKSTQVNPGAKVKEI